jgi:O-antigen ligase
MEKKNKSVYRTIVIYSFFATLSISPWVSRDSMIIPKIIILFALAFYLLPKIIYNFPKILKYRKIKILIGIIILIFIQTLLVAIVSSAPIEQQIFGRTGRGLGIITSISLLIVLLASAIFVRFYEIKTLLIGVVSSSLITSVYSLFQSFGIDFLNWTSRTNGVIGTLGNPNFQSSFAALALIPTLILFTRFKFYTSFIFGSILLWVIFRTQSTQGYVSALLAVSIFAIVFYWYRLKFISVALVFLTLFSGALAILGMLNRGPLSTYLYKVSVQSRGDFWRSALATANEHPFFGVGIDSFGDSYLKYRDEIAISHPWAEYTDNAHNFFLEYAATAGYPMLILQISLIILTLISFTQLQRRISRFDKDLISIFVAWVVFQAQSIISPGNIPMMVWNAVLTGSLIGISELNSRSIEELIPAQNQLIMKTRIHSYSLVIASLFICFPLFNTDRLQMQAMKSGNGDLAISSAKRYPESVMRYQIITRELLNSNLPSQALDLARSAVDFNPNSANLWALILINPSAPFEERVNAKAEILKLDPLNQEVVDYEIR